MAIFGLVFLGVSKTDSNHWKVDNSWTSVGLFVGILLVHGASRHERTKITLARMVASLWGCSMYEPPLHTVCWTLGRHLSLCHRIWCMQMPISRSHQVGVEPGTLPAGAEAIQGSFCQTSVGSTLAGWRVQQVAVGWEHTACIICKSHWNKY